MPSFGHVQASTVCVKHARMLDWPRLPTSGLGASKADCTSGPLKLQYSPCEQRGAHL